MKPEEAYRFKIASDPCVSSDRVYFTQSWSEGNDYLSSIYSFDGNNVKRHTFGDHERSPSVYKGRLYYITSGNGQDTLNVITESGDTSEIFTFSKILKYRFYGDDVVAIVEDPPKRSDIFVTTRIKYRSDGRGLLWTRRKLVMGNSSRIETLVEGDFDIIDVAAERNMIVFSSSKEDDDLDLSLQDVYSYSLETRTINKLTDGKGKAVLVAVGNNEEVAYVGHREGVALSFPSRINLLKARKSIEVGKDIDVVFTDMFVSGQNKLLFDDAYYTIGQVGGDNYLYMYDGQLRKLTPDGISVRDFDVKSGKISYVYSSFEKPSILVFEGRKYDPNPEFTGTIAEKNTVNGKDYWAMITGKDNPTVLFVHGGPHNAYGTAYFSEMDFMAKNGFNVIFGNPIGSVGYGADFAAGCIGDWGGQDFRDLLGFIDHAQSKHGLKEDMHITGLSYGGYMTNAAITQTHRFKSAVAEASVTNFFTMCGTSDIGFWFNAVEAKIDDPFTPENQEKLHKMSPIYKAKFVTTPTMYLHGEIDYRCPIEQTEQMYRAIRMNGVETVLVRLDGESHPFLRIGKPKVKEARLRMKLKWFKDHASS